jgi:hypothetical protein
VYCPGQAKQKHEPGVDNVATFDTCRVTFGMRAMLSAGLSAELGPDYSPGPDLAKYEYPESDDEYGHRMIVNAFALAFTNLSILAGVWLALTMAHA